MTVAIVGWRGFKLAAALAAGLALAACASSNPNTAAVGGGAAQRISFGEGSYSTPVWSPRGDAIAFTKQNQGQFAIGIMGVDGRNERILTSGFHNEGPTWSPNGRVLMFFRDPGGNSGPALHTVDLTGRNEQRVPTPSYASDPAWSPLLT